MSSVAPTRRAFLTVMGVAAVSVFLLAAAASTIVASASGPGDRELAYAANSVVVADVGQAIETAPLGVRVPVLIDVNLGSVLSDGTPLKVPEAADGVKIVGIGLTELSAPQLNQLLASHAGKWSAVSDDAATRLRDATIDAGVRLHRAGVTALRLPEGLLSAGIDGCTIADGLYRGGVVPIFRVAADGGADDQALKICLKHFANRNPTAWVDSRTQAAALSLFKAADRVTVFLETDKSGMHGALAAGAAAIVVDGQPRETTVDDLAGSISETERTQILLAARRIRRWLAGAPAVGTTPPTVPPTQAKKGKSSVPLRVPPKLSRHGSADGGGRVAPRPAAPKAQPPARGQANPGDGQSNGNSGGASRP